VNHITLGWDNGENDRNPATGVKTNELMNGESFMRQCSKRMILPILALGAAMAALDGEVAWRSARAEDINGINARIVAINIPGASAISQVGKFLNSTEGACGGSPIATAFFSSYTQNGAVLDANRILVGSESNFGAPPLTGVGQEGSILSIDPNSSAVLSVPATFASSGGQASTRNGACRCSAPTARTGSTQSTIPTQTRKSTLG
jgi:hypothetical protein